MFTHRNATIKHVYRVTAVVTLSKLSVARRDCRRAPDRGCAPLVAYSFSRDSLLRLPVARVMCDRLAALDGLVPPAVVACRSTPSSPNAYRAVVQLQQLEKTSSVPDLQQKRHHHGDGPAADQQAAPASACPDSKSDGCLTDTGRAPVTSLSGTFLTPPCKVSLAFVL